MDLISYIFVFVGSCVVLFLLFRIKHPKLAIPGPKGWPLIGNVIQMDAKRPHITLSTWAEKYGDIFAITKFTKPILVCNSFEAIWEIYITKSNEFGGRPEIFPIKYITEDADIVTSDLCPHWMKRKKIFMTSVQKYGLNQWEDIVMDVISDMKDDFKEMKGQPFDPMESIQWTLLNILSLTLFGSRFEKDDPDVKLLNHYILVQDEIWAPSLTFFLLDAFPFLKNFPAESCQRLDFIVNEYNKSWIPRQLRKRQEIYDPDNLSCVADYFIKQFEEDFQNKPSLSFEEKHLRVLCVQFIAAGMATSMSVMYSALGILVNFPDMQSRLQEEIDMVLAGMCPKYTDKESMSYVQAFLEEVLRYTSAVPLSVPHMTTQDTTICGHFVPKGTETWPNIWHLCHEKMYWGDPWIFRPERFLDKDGTFLTIDHPNRKRLLVFGGGRRVCAGEVMAKIRIFLIITSLLQMFNLQPESDETKPDCDPHTYVISDTIRPMPYKIRAIPRNV